jgi:hypothetical protein
VNLYLKKKVLIYQNNPFKSYFKNLITKMLKYNMVYESWPRINNYWSQYVQSNQNDDEKFKNFKECLYSHLTFSKQKIFIE